MTIAGGVVIFIVWWWLVFLFILPRNVTARWEAEEDDGVKGADPGAPVSPEIGKKAALTTMITVVLTVITIAIIMSGLINFRD